MFQGCFMYAYVSSVYRSNVYCEIIVVFHENNDTVLILSIVIALEPWFLLSLFYSLLLYYHYIPLLSLLYSNFFFTLSEDKVVNGDRFPNAQNRKVSNSVFQKKIKEDQNLFNWLWLLSTYNPEFEILYFISLSFRFI